MEGERGCGQVGKPVKMRRSRGKQLEKKTFISVQVALLTAGKFIF